MKKIINKCKHCNTSIERACFKEGYYSCLECKDKRLRSYLSKKKVAKKIKN